jgi:uncharacterized protein YukE
MDPTQITYNIPGVADLSSDVGSRAAQLSEIHQDIQQLTQALADYFAGKGATTFFDAQQQALHGLEGLIATVAQHGGQINTTLGNAIATDGQIAQGFLA